MASTTEAQRLVAVSLGKIAQSRTKRTGINLHKNLLVSTVLFRARTIVIRERYFSQSSESIDSETSCDSDTETEEVTPECEESSAPASENIVQDISDSNNSEPEEDEENQLMDKENVCTRDSSASTQVRECRNTSVLGSCENTTQNLDNKEITRCERCTKRRLSDAESNESITPIKKVKSDDCVVDTKTQESSDSEEPMDQTQITHLVDSFNTGFSGLLTTGNTCLNQGQKSDSNLPSKHHIGLSSKGQGLSEAFNHCSTQIKESFETLATPIIALTV